MWAEHRSKTWRSCDTVLGRCQAIVGRPGVSSVSLERLQEDANGDLLYTFTHPWSDEPTGTRLAPSARPARQPSCGRRAAGRAHGPTWRGLGGVQWCGDSQVWGALAGVSREMGLYMSYTLIHRGV
jgi:hypothetical protein